MGLEDPAFGRWLSVVDADHGGYRHARLDEEPAERAAGLAALARVVEAAHEDALRWIKEMSAISLDPFDDDDVAVEYPHGLHTITLQGYMGKIFAGLYAENFRPHGLPWEVPAFLFRFHNAAIEGLDRRLPLGDEASRTPGRTGDDCVAFHRGPDGRIEAWLNSEAKCTAGHRSALIAQGHVQVGRPLVRPASGLQLIDVLLDSDRPDRDEWVAALRLLRSEAARADPATRADLFLYVCGQRPIRARSWISEACPEPSYRGLNPLEAVEIHLDDVDAVLVVAYPGHTVDRA